MIKSEIQKLFLDALLVGDRQKCYEIFNSYITEGHSLKVVYETILKKALYRIGELWEYGKISVATEHLASAIVENLMNAFYYRVISGKKIDKNVVVSCVEKEYHQIGIKMVSDVFEMNGWNSHFLGANTPTKELITFLKTIKPDILALSLSLYFHLPVLEKMIIEIREEFPELLILVGGQAFRYGGADMVFKYPLVMLESDLEGVELYLRKLKQHG